MPRLINCEIFRRPTCYTLDFEVEGLPAGAVKYNVSYDGEGPPHALYAANFSNDGIPCFVFLSPEKIIRAKQFVIWLYSSDGVPIDHIVVPNGLIFP